MLMPNVFGLEEKEMEGLSDGNYQVLQLKTTNAI